MWSGFDVQLDQRQVEHVNKVLYTVPDKSRTVFRNAILRGMVAAKTQAKREIKERYDITTGNMRTYETIRERVFDFEDGVVGHISFSGEKIPLYRFHPSRRSDRRTSKFANGKNSGFKVPAKMSAADLRGRMQERPAAFIATFRSGHVGMFKRMGEKTKNGKPKISEYYGFSVADMLDYQEARENVQERAQEIIGRRIDQELLRILNGI